MKTILLIEDNKDVRENTAEILELANFKVLTAANGKLGVDLALKNKIDLIICDIMMPELDGFGVLHMLHKNPETEYIPFIFLTAKTERSDFRKGMEMGADDYITKPFDDIELLNAIETRLKKKEILNKTITPDPDGINQLLKVSASQLFHPEKVETFETLNQKKKQTLYTEGHKPNFLFYVVKGKVKSFKINDFGKELITDIFTTGDFFGYIPLLEESSYTDNAEILEDAQLKLIPKSDFMNLIDNNKEVSIKFIKLLSKNLNEKEERLLNLAYNSLRKRVSEGLLSVASKFKTQTSDKIKIEMTREDLAQVVGTATESLIRTLSDFKEEKLIEINGGKISNLNEEKLKNLIN